MYLKIEEWAYFSLRKIGKGKSKIFGFLDEGIFLNAGIEISGEIELGFRGWRWMWFERGIMWIFYFVVKGYTLDDMLLLMIKDFKIKVIKLIIYFIRVINGG